MTQAAGSLALPCELDIKAARPLLGDLKALRGSDAKIDASKVERVGAQCLQVLVSAAATWRAEGRTLSIEEPSPAFLDAARSIGLDLMKLSAGAK